MSEELEWVRDADGVGTWRKPNGGSQTAKVVGPFNYTHADFAADGDEITLFAPGDENCPAVGDVIFDYFVAAESVSKFLDTNDGFFVLGQDIDFDPSDPNLGGSAGKNWWSYQLAYANSLFTENPTRRAISSRPDTNFGTHEVVVPNGSPVKIKWYANGDDPPTVGDLDIYFVFATPLVPPA